MTDTLVVFATNRVSGLKRQAAEDPRYRMIIFTEHKYRADYEAAGFDPAPPPFRAPPKWARP